MWITASGAFLAIELVGFGLRPGTKRFDNRLHFIISAFMFYGASLAAVSHAMAFRPVDKSHMYAFPTNNLSQLPNFFLFPQVVFAEDIFFASLGFVWRESCSSSGEFKYSRVKLEDSLQFYSRLK